MLPPILNSIKDQLVKKDEKRSQSENSFLDELLYIEKILQHLRQNTRVIRPLKGLTMVEDSRPQGE